MWRKKDLPSLNVLYTYPGLQNLPQTSANNLEMHKLFIKAAFENTFLPCDFLFSINICLAFVLFRLPELSLHGTAEEWDMFLHGSLNPDSRTGD